MATVTVVKPKPKMVPASSVKGYRPDWHGFVGAPEKQNPPAGFVLQTGPRHGNYTTTTPTKTGPPILKVMARPSADRVPTNRGKVTVGKADPRFILGVGRTIIPHNGISLGSVNGPGI